jgi:hypothetical protein
MRIKHIIMAGIILLLGGANPAFAPSLAQKPTLAMLDQLEAGRWELRIRGAAAGAVESVCINNGRKLIQLRHQSQLCERTIVDDSANSVTIHYTCQGKGYGLTHIRRESGRLVQIESQGIADGSPFEFQAEARKFGECAS